MQASEEPKREAPAKRLELDVVDPHRISQYRSLTMRAAFLAQDRPDLSETVKCLARKMQGPTEAEGHYANGAEVHPAEVHQCGVVSAHADSDFAGCLLTWKSTTGFPRSVFHQEKAGTMPW